ncbi:MAG TPA: MaoC family dehydratase [Dehalococcoidia bacterium]
MSVTPVVRDMSQERINGYADASGDHNPIHVDDAFAKGTPLGGTIAHGMLVLASISEMMTLELGEAWLRRGKLRVRFRGPVRSGDTISASAQEHSNGGYVVEVRTQDGEVVITGNAELVGDG